MFIDEARISVKAGDGGDGCNSFHRHKLNRIGYPDGGPGGDGGDAIFEADENVQTLLDFHYRQHFRAESGSHGGSNTKKGHRGEDIHIKVPPGTLIRDAGTGLVLRDLVRPGDRVVIAKGGAGGRGNSRGRESEDGAPGEEKAIILELKLIADAGIIGYPNAGKSTLISKISSARPKIANYPFTTKEPALGVVKLYDGAGLVVADIPGLIEGAHKGKGLGHKFLRHIERTKVLIHLVDIAALEGRDPYTDYLNLNNELKLYSRELSKKPQIIALNKIDCAEKKKIAAFKGKIGKKKVYPVSALKGDGLKELLRALYTECKGL